MSRSLVESLLKINHTRHASALRLAAGPLLHLLTRRWPPLQQEALGHTEFIQAYVGADAEAAIILAGKEHIRLLKWLPVYLEEVRSGAKGEPGPAAYHAAFVTVSARLLEFLVEALHRDTAHESAERLLALQNCQKLLASIEEDVFYLYQIVHGRTGKGKAGQLAMNIVESLDTILLTTIAAADTGDPDERELLAVLTADRGDLMERVRKNYLSAELELSPEERALIPYVTHLFERAAWSLGQYGRLLGRGSRGEVSG